MWLYAHAEEIGIDQSRIGIGGDSAGGVYPKKLLEIKSMRTLVLD
jgi:carboxylesterase type B